MSVVLCDSSDLVAQRASEWLAEHIAAAISQDGVCRLALSGGTTPKLTLEKLRAHAVDWSRVEILFVDERCVGADDPDSNHRMVRDALLGPMKIAAARVHRMEGERADPTEAAARYADLLRELGLPNVALLGIGEDGHTASLFPGSPLVDSKELVAAVFDSPKPPPKRLTLLPAALVQAECVVLATGTGKATAVNKALARGASPKQVPSSLFASATWFLDRLAAAELPRDH